MVQFRPSRRRSSTSDQPGCCKRVELSRASRLTLAKTHTKGANRPSAQPHLLSLSTMAAERPLGMLLSSSKGLQLRAQSRVVTP